LPRYLVRGLQIMRKNVIHDLSTQQQDLESIPVNFESLLFVDSFEGVLFYSSGREVLGSAAVQCDIMIF
jgi:hypothetical protein